MSPCSSRLRPSDGLQGNLRRSGATYVRFVAERVHDALAGGDPVDANPRLAAATRAELDQRRNRA